MAAPLRLTREQILAYRRRVQALDRRLPAGATSLRLAAQAGLQDSMPRAALLSIHARVEGTQPTTWEDPALVQLWGPRYSAYVVAADDIGVFTVGRLGDDPKGRIVPEQLAARLRKALDGRRMKDADAGLSAGEHPNRLRYATLTGTVLIRWDGARAPTLWTVPAPSISPAEARLELARRYLHAFGPTTPGSFAAWAGIGQADGPATFADLAGELVAVLTPIGPAWILASDEAALRQVPEPADDVRLLPSGDSYFLLWGADRELMLPDPDQRAALWTSRVWPGAVLLDGEIVGTWRRASHVVTITPWRAPAAGDRLRVEEEAAALPLPGLAKPIVVRWAPMP